MQTQTAVGLEYHIRCSHIALMKSVHPNYDYVDEVMSKMLKDGSHWRCLVCNHSSNRKSSVYYHVEAKHTASSGFSCHVCRKFCPTTNALRTHLSRQHRQNMWIIYECIFEIQDILFIISFSIWGSDKVENVIIQRWGWPLEVSGLWVPD